MRNANGAMRRRPPIGNIGSQAAKSCGCDLKSMARGIKEEAERAAIVQALEQTGGNKQEAAILLRISLRALHYKVRVYAIESIARQQQCSFAHENSGAPPYRLSRLTRCSAPPMAACRWPLPAMANLRIAAMANR